MERYEIILIALILLIVFAGVQVKNFITFLKGNLAEKTRPEPVPVKTVLPAENAVELKKKTIVTKKAVVKKAAVKKAIVKKTVNNKTVAKKGKISKKKVSTKKS